MQGWACSVRGWVTPGNSRCCRSEYFLLSLFFFLLAPLFFFFFFFYNCFSFTLCVHISIYSQTFLSNSGAIRIIRAKFHQNQRKRLRGFPDTHNPTLVKYYQNSQNVYRSLVLKLMKMSTFFNCEMKLILFHISTFFHLFIFFLLFFF